MGHSRWRAVVMREFGGPEKLRLEEVQAPSRRVCASGRSSSRSARSVCAYQTSSIGAATCLGPGCRRSWGMKSPGRSWRSDRPCRISVPATAWRTVQRVHCGRCELCRRGRTTLCKEGVFFGEEIRAAYAEYCRVRGAGAGPHPPRDVPFERGRSAPCTIGTALHVARTRGGVQLERDRPDHGRLGRRRPACHPGLPADTARRSWR